MIFAVVTALVLLSTLPLLQSCSNSENAPMLQSKQLEFLDMDVSNLQNMSQEQKTILKKAIDRLHPFVTCTNKVYSLSIQSGKEVEISDGLFDLLKSTMMKTNLTIKDLNVVPDKNDPTKLHLIKKTTLYSNVRYKIQTDESTPPVGSQGIVYTEYGSQLYLTQEDIYRIGDSCSYVSGVGWVVAGGCTLTGQLPEAAIAGIAAAIWGMGSTGINAIARNNPNGLEIDLLGGIIPYGIYQR